MLETVIPTKSNISIPKEHYSHIGTYIESADAFSRTMFRPIFIVDMHTKSFLYVSSIYSSLIGEDTNNSFAHEDIPTLKMIFENAYDLFLSYPVTERMKLVFSFSFNSIRYGKTRVLHQSMTPLALTEDGDLWLVLCTTSFSSKKKPGDYVMRLHGDDEYMIFNPSKGRWYHKEGISLIEEEKDILFLSSQGYTMKEIGAILCKSLDSIKMYKRAIFSKLGVKSITEAVLAAINQNLI